MALLTVRWLDGAVTSGGAKWGQTLRRIPMKYMISWFERPQGSPMEYENAQKRILEVFTQWKAPANFKIELFVIRVGDWGGDMMLDCDDPLAGRKVWSMLPAVVVFATS